MKMSVNVSPNFHALINDMNTPALSYGRLPEKPNECVGDARYFLESDIGKKITISKNNDKDTKDLFAYDTYEIVGLCESPLYLNFERGSTSLGNGSVATYLYVPADGWDSEVYTEIYVTLENQGVIYSDEYKKNAKAMEKPLESALETCASSRYDEILDEATESSTMHARTCRCKSGTEESRRQAGGRAEKNK